MNEPQLSPYQREQEASRRVMVLFALSWIGGMYTAALFLDAVQTLPFWFEIGVVSALTAAPGLLALSRPYRKVLSQRR